MKRKEFTIPSNFYGLIEDTKKSIIPELYTILPLVEPVISDASALAKYKEQTEWMMLLARVSISKDSAIR